MRLAELGQIEPRHGAFAVEQHFGDGFGGFGLADAGRPEQEKATDGPARAEPGCVAPQDARDARDLLAVTDHAIGQDLFEA